MSKLLKFSELAKALGLTNASISMAIKNKTLIPEENQKRIDINSQINKLWIERQIASGRDFDLNNIFKKTNDYKQKLKEENKEQNSNQTSELNNSKKRTITVDDIRKIELKKKIAELKRTENAVILDQLKIEKQEGRLIPFDAVQNFFLFVVETFSKTFSQESKSIANIMVNRLGGERKHLIEIQKDLSIKLEELKEQSIKDALSGLDNIVDEYKEVRSRGEKK